MRFIYVREPRLPFRPGFQIATYYNVARTIGRAEGCSRFNELHKGRDVHTHNGSR